MKLISVDLARATWLFPVEEIIPLGGANGPAIVQAIASKYDFAQAPTNPTREDIDKNGLKFAAGQFEYENEPINVGEFIVYNDGIMTSSTSTENSEAFLDDVSDFLRDDFGFRPIVSNVKRIFLSSVVVEFATSISSALKAFETLSNIVGAKLNAIDGTNYPVELARIDFDLNKDPEFRPPFVPRFSIEKRINTPSSLRRYISGAPIRTRDHLALLDQIERELEGND
jgi:hypothetical protein